MYTQNQWVWQQLVPSFKHERSDWSQVTVNRLQEVLEIIQFEPSIRTVAYVKTLCSKEQMSIRGKEILQR